MRISAAARDAARLMAVVVLPTPPFWFEMAMIRPIFSGMYHRGGAVFHVEQSTHRPLTRLTLASGIGWRPEKAWGRKRFRILLQSSLRIDPEEVRSQRSKTSARRSEKGISNTRDGETGGCAPFVNQTAVTVRGGVGRSFSSN